ncbi:hypothetical protein JTB14_020870 [Gonioctena quinquepunctata]|nr:hypothetical protein JTB14_020870 [Gonioctena quinquepunctata]
MEKLLIVSKVIVFFLREETLLKDKDAYTSEHSSRMIKASANVLSDVRNARRTGSDLLKFCLYIKVRACGGTRSELLIVGGDSEKKMSRLKYAHYKHSWSSEWKLMCLARVSRSDVYAAPHPNGHSRSPCSFCANSQMYTRLKCESYLSVNVTSTIVFFLCV